MNTLHPHRSHRLFVALFFSLCLTLEASAQGLAYVMKISRTATVTIDGTATLNGYLNRK